MISWGSAGTSAWTGQGPAESAFQEKSFYGHQLPLIYVLFWQLLVALGARLRGGAGGCAVVGAARALADTQLPISRARTALQPVAENFWDAISKNVRDSVSSPWTADPLRYSAHLNSASPTSLLCALGRFLYLSLPKYPHLQNYRR